VPSVAFHRRVLRTKKRTKLPNQATQKTEMKIGLPIQRHGPESHRRRVAPCRAT